MDENHTDLIAGKYASIRGMEIQKIQMVVHIFSRFALFTELMWQLMWLYRRVESLFKLFTVNNVPFHRPEKGRLENQESRIGTGTGKPEQEQEQEQEPEPEPEPE